MFGPVEASAGLCLSVSWPLFRSVEALQSWEEILHEYAETVPACVYWDEVRREES